MASTPTNVSRGSRRVTWAEYENDFLGGSPSVNSSSTLPPATGASASTPVKEITGATHAGTPKAPAKGNSNGGRRNVAQGPKPSTPPQPQGPWGKKPVAQEVAAAPAVASSAGGNSPQVASANPSAVQKNSAKGAKAVNPMHPSHPRSQKGRDPCRTGAKCQQWLIGTGCRFHHSSDPTDEQKKAAFAEWCKTITQLCNCKSKENCARYRRMTEAELVALAEAGITPPVPCGRFHCDEVKNCYGTLVSGSAIFGAKEVALDPDEKHLAPNTWASNALKEQASAKVEVKVAEDKAAKALAYADEVVTDANFRVTDANFRVAEAESYAGALEANLAAFVFPQPCWHCLHECCDGRNH